MNGSVQSTAVVQLWACPGNMPKPAEHHHVYHIAVHLNLLGGQMVHCCLDSGLTPIDLKTKRTHLLLHNMQRADKNFEHLYEQCNVVSVIQVREDLLAKGCLG